MLANDIQIIFGGGSFLSGSVDEVQKWLEMAADAGFNIIDTAALYGASEQLLGEAGAASKFTIDTKHPGGLGDQFSTKDVVIASCRESLKTLKTDSVDVYYLHAPDRRVPWKDTLEGLDQMYQQGAFKRLGLSNYLAQEVEDAVQVAKDNGLVVPSVYQGNYSAVARRAEDEIFPILRKHDIAFYAYSPIAGGFLSKSKAELSGTEGRFSEGHPLSEIYNGMYNRPSFVHALDAWGQIAKDEGIPRAELAYRWVTYHSKLQGKYGDALIVGARKEEQLRQTVQALKKGPLSAGAVKRIDEIWDSVKADSSLDNFQMLSAKK
ncbi:aflatoxin B1 aldehyde reductase member 3 [Metarhizium guizhouense ARSEF 977]|uniref:Aflatoxin B1 aldehyde reductase member 3 n=1 Tax=Metarhizium guizhouense (strain ARSEF 977) TaxID=1276136 RepID=A0A0B4GQH6_METGA|nr:aflatoxin B1 aldehyde reductase member 3 [Metarhizium guizhouense ARSEF 977]